MADSVQDMIASAIRSLVEREETFAERALEIEKDVNSLEVEIEEEVLRLLATRQPAAGDLRLLVALLKINSNLERVADQACNISETVRFLLREPSLKVPLVDIPTMAGLVQKMVKNSIHAFVHHDPELARKVCEDDDQVDWINDQIFRILLTHMIENPKVITRAVDHILVSRNLERIADHATNISEEVIFIEQGKLIKHHLEEKSAGFP
jgi:phosphate transport system protein